MKHGKTPTREQRKLLQAWNLTPADWLVTKDTPEEMHIVHRFISSTTRIIPKEI